MNLAAWQIRNSVPVRLSVGSIELEKHLEDWIAHDIGLIDQSLLVVQRQLHVHGGYLDLLCVDAQGRATVLEIKRGKLMRETIAQALDYASSVAAMPVEALRARVHEYLDVLPEHPGLGVLLDPTVEGQREVAVIVVGVGKDSGLHRLIDFLGETFSVPIRAVTFDVFDVVDGQQIIVREETDPEPTAAQSHASKYAATSVIDTAGGPESPDGRRMLLMVEAVERNGLFARPYKYSFMVTPPQNKGRYLAVFGRWSGKLQVSHGADAFEEFFAVEAEAVDAILGASKINTPIDSDEAAREWGERLDRIGKLLQTGKSEVEA